MIITLTMITAVVVIGLILKTFIAQRREQRLRDNPPAREWVEVSLPRGSADAAERMAMFYRKALPLLQVEPSDRAHGAGVMDAVYIGEAPAGQEQVVIRFYLAAPPDLMPALKRLLKQSFGSMCEIAPVDDPLATARQLVRPPEAEHQVA